MTYRTFSHLFLLMLGIFVLSGMPVHAVAADEDMEGISAEQAEASESVQERVSAFTDNLDNVSQKHFFALYGSYNLIQVVNEVQAQVSDAVNKCGEANPDMKEGLEARYKDWDGAIQPILDDANANVDNMVVAQDYAKPREIKKIFKFVDKKRNLKDKEIETYPVTSPEACEYLLKKMDDTQENLTQLLQSTLVSLPNALINSDDENGQDENDQDENDQGEDE